MDFARVVCRLLHVRHSVTFGVDFTWASASGPRRDHIHGRHPDTWSSVRQGRRVPGEPPELPTHRPRRAPSSSRSLWSALFRLFMIQGDCARGKGAVAPGLSRLR